MAEHRLKEHGKDSLGRTLYVVETEYGGGNIDYSVFLVFIFLFFIASSGILALGLFLVFRELFDFKKDPFNRNLSIIIAIIAHIVYLYFNIQIGRYHPFGQNYPEVMPGESVTIVRNFLIKIFLGGISFIALYKIAKK